MHNKLILRLSVLSFIATSAVAGQEPQLEASRPAIEQIVQHYILQHPEVLLESVRLYQERERAAQKERSREAVSARLSDLQHDPSSPAAGPADGVTVVEFFDYHCGYCKRADPTVMKLLSDHPGVRFVFKDFPILGPESSLAAKASLAAAQQGDYLGFHRGLMALSGSITMNAIEALAGKQGLDVPKLKVAMESPEVQSTLARNRELAINLGVSATPTFVIGSEVISGVIDAARFEQLIAQAQTGSVARAAINSPDR